MRVVTADVPTLCPMLRMKFMSPAAALVFSADRPMYPASVRGTNRKATGMYCHTRNEAAELKLMSRSICLQNTYMLTASVIQPKAIRWRAWNREVSMYVSCKQIDLLMSRSICLQDTYMLTSRFQARHLIAFGWITLAVSMYVFCK